MAGKGLSKRRDLILSDSTERLVGNVHSATYYRVKAHRGEKARNKVQSVNPSSNKQKTICVCLGACDKGRERARIKRNMA